MLHRGLQFGLLTLAGVSMVPGASESNPSARGGAYQLSNATLSTAGSAVVENSVLILGEPLTGYGDNAFFSLDVGLAPVLAALAATPGDADGDGDVDLADHAVFYDCMAGPDAAPTPEPPITLELCLNAFDFDVDLDVDLYDAAAFNLSFGP